ncbi:DNA-binding response regulator [Paraphotobacterium marinum]|uniref:DNA-binding response regulator n=1 Tax=Paraphotobacterium marinum TaxID=1755811 RepID=A0A220VEZ5_9GAMM|nr:response regulator [Paraphotobacterium marinum]ASK78840.1 DNA-binding response regulator [Paraphotobacterium marinum]
MKKILIIDDDQELTSLLKELLELENYDTSIASNGEEGLKKYTEDIDLILLDVMMPILNGFDTLKRFRDKLNVITPILMLTAKGDEIDKVMGLEMGADDYLAKPFSERELLARIKAILRRFDKSDLKGIVNNESKVIKAQDIEICQTTQEVICQDEEIPLTGTEFILLTYFSKNIGKIISKNELSESVLGKPLSQYDRSLDMHISNLRKKLPTRDNGMPRFKTLRGKGYIFVE